MGRLFIAGLWLVGLLAGLVLLRLPDLPVPVPALTIPLVVALLLDLVLMIPVLRSSRLGLVTMQDRMIGVVGASLIAIAVTTLAGR